jgi:hypothetical protein
MRSLLPRLGLAYFAIQGFLFGAYALFAPEHFFEHFPGGGHAWLDLDGPYNEHLVRDFGALNLALGAVALCALVFATRQLMIATAVAELAYAVPHITYHIATHSRIGERSDQIGAIGGLIVSAVIAALLLVRCARERGHLVA